MSAALCSFAISNLKPLIVKYIYTIRKSAKIDNPNVPGREFKNVLVKRFSNTRNARCVKSIQFCQRKDVKTQVVL